MQNINITICNSCHGSEDISKEHLLELSKIHCSANKGVS